MVGGEFEDQMLSREGWLIHGRRLRIDRGRNIFYNRRFSAYLITTYISSQHTLYI